MPRAGRVLEIGCGTAPLLRWICRGGGFAGYGIDVSETAIAMAQAQSADFPIELECGDFCQLSGRENFYDLVIDGHCLHCVTGARDREVFFDRVRAQMRPGGIFILMSMCGPVDRAAFSEKYPGQLLHEDVIYSELGNLAAGEEIQGVMAFAGKKWLPTRFVGDWRGILAEMEHHGFETLNLCYDAGEGDEAVGNLVAAGRRRAV